MAVTGEVEVAGEAAAGAEPFPVGGALAHSMTKTSVKLMLVLRGPGGLMMRPLPGKNVKEADAIKVPAYPNPEQDRAWKSPICNEIDAASGSGENAFRWALKPESPEATFERLQGSDGLDCLDAKLASGFAKNATSEPGRRATLAVERLALQERMLKGRLILWMIHDYHKLDEARGALYHFTDLMSVKLREPLRRLS